MTLEILYRPSDLHLDEVRRIDDECFPDEPSSRDFFETAVASDFWVARREGRILGFSFMKTTPDLAWIARVGVTSAERNRGVGNRLMEAMLEHCRRIPRHTVILYVEQENPAAVHLYRKHGFEVSEETWQYVVPVRRFFGRSEADRGGVTVRAITDVPPAERPTFAGQWSGLAEQHDPPEAHILVFFAEGGDRIGHCRLSPGFPGCFPFEVADPAANLAGALDAIRPLLSDEHDILKLTIGSAEVAAACADLGFRLNYRLFRMTVDLRVHPRFS